MGKLDTSDVTITAKDGKEKKVAVGTRVEIHPCYDLWMQGAKYAVIKGRSSESGLIAVKMEHLSVKGTRYFPSKDLFEV